MSATNRPTTRWLSSTKSNNLINPSTRKKPLQSSINYQQTFTQRMAKTRHDVEELFKLYYAANIKFDTFQQQVVTGTRIPSAHITTSTNLPHHLMHNSSNVFRSKHCVSREDDSPTELIEPQIINDEPFDIPIKRTVEVRIDHQPIIVPSISPTSDIISMPINSDLNLSENSPLINESTIIKSIEDIPNEFFEYNHPIRRSKSTLGQSSNITLPPISSLMTNRKDLMNLSHSSFSTSNYNQSHIVTGSAVIVRERSPTKSGLNKQQRIKSTPQHSNLKTSSTSLQSELPICLGTRVVSIPSKCNRYVLVTLPQNPVRYNTPTYVERLLLPERFPTLFQNIVHNRNNK